MNEIRKKISYLDGLRLKRAVIAGSNWLRQMQLYLDNINVFPVPDHDTGTNMSYTMNCVADAVSSSKEIHINKLSGIIAEKALINAQGNSGAILAQFFQGLHEGLKDYERVNVELFAKAACTASRWSMEAVLQPREGTILSVIRDWSEFLKDKSYDTDDFVDIFRMSYPRALDSLNKTTEELDQLEKAGVVDAGAQGFIYILDGIMDFVENGRIDRKVEVRVLKNLANFRVRNEPLEESKSRFCTECLVSGDYVDTKAMKKELKKLGDSIVVAGSSNRVRVHIHTNMPSTVIDALSAYGDIKEDKVDDIHQQYTDACCKHPPIAIVTDSTCDLPEELMRRFNVHIVPLHVIFGPRSYLDKFTISIKKFYSMLLTSQYHPKTSQPSQGDFRRMYEHLVNHYEHIISIHISSRLSGTFQSAQKAASMFPGRITVINSRTASIGLGLIVLEAGRAIEVNLTVDEVLMKIKKLAGNIILYLCPETIMFLVRGGRISKAGGFIGKILNFKPIFSINGNGEIRVIKKVMGNTSIHKEAVKLIKKDHGRKKIGKIIIGTGDSDNTLKWYSYEIKKEIAPEELIVADISAVIGTHVGPEAAGVSFVGN